MANIKEEKTWEEGIYQLEVTDPVVGGIDGISNKQAKQLANRTSYLKKQIEDNKSGADLALATKRDVNDSYSKTEVDKKFTDTGKLIEEKLGKSETAADSEKLGRVAAKEFMQKGVYKPNNESSANSLVLRDSNGDFAGHYITAGHFRLQAPNQNNLFGGDSELLFRGGSAENDNYIRAVSVPYAASVMGGARHKSNLAIRNALKTGRCYIYKYYGETDNGLYHIALHNRGFFKPNHRWGRTVYNRRWR